MTSNLVENCLKCCCPCWRPPTSPIIPQANNDVIHLLMVGNGEVGKSTIIKQMMNLVYSKSDKYSMYDEEWRNVQRPFTEDERRQYKLLVHQNILRIIGTLILKIQDYNLRYDSPENEIAAETLMELIGEVDTLQTRHIELNPNSAQMIERLWSDSGIRRAYDLRCRYLISDSTTYFLAHEKLVDASRPDYIPTTDDVLRARDPTRGVHDYNFRIEDTKFSFRDLGGQPVEKAQYLQRINTWMNDCRNSRRNFIVFVASLADYNQISEIHPPMTLLDDSIALLTILMDLPQLRNTGFILFLNKVDKFHEKLLQFRDFHDLRWSFNDYMPTRFIRNQNPNDPRYQEMAKRSIAKKFHEAMLGTTRRDEALYCRFTCATDREGMQAIISAVRMDILTDIIRRGNMP